MTEDVLYITFIFMDTFNLLSWTMETVFCPGGGGGGGGLNEVS